MKKLFTAWLKPVKNWKVILTELVVIAAVVFCVLAVTNKKATAPVQKPAAAAVAAPVVTPVAPSPAATVKPDSVKAALDKPKK
jgi:hypothetical protein